MWHKMDLTQHVHTAVSRTSDAQLEAVPDAYYGSDSSSSWAGDVFNENTNNTETTTGRAVQLTLDAVPITQSSFTTMDFASPTREGERTRATQWQVGRNELTPRIVTSRDCLIFSIAR